MDKSTVENLMDVMDKNDRIKKMHVKLTTITEALKSDDSAYWRRYAYTEHVLDMLYDYVNRPTQGDKKWIK